MPELIQLLNKRRRPFNGTLFHNDYCLKGGSCGCRQERFLAAVSSRKGRDAPGTVGFKNAVRQMPVGVSIRPRTKSVPLSRAVLKVPGFKQAIAEGWLVPVAAAPSAPVREVSAQVAVTVAVPAPVSEKKIPRRRGGSDAA